MSQSTDGEPEDWFRSTLPYDHPLFGSSSSGSDYDTEDALSQPTTDEECVGSGWLESPPSLAFTPYSWSEFYPQSGCLRHSLLSCGPCDTRPFVPTQKGYIRGYGPRSSPGCSTAHLSPARLPSDANSPSHRHLSLTP
jgi:hypothetical protein